LRQALAALLDALSPGTWDKLFHCLPGARIPSAPGDKLQKLAILLRCDSRRDLYRQLVSLWPNPASVVIGGEETIPGQDWSNQGNFAEQMMLRDALEYLPDDILTKVDRASMSVSLETRAPFLDHRVFEFAWQLPMPLKIRGQESKWLLRQLLYRYVPRDLIERPKAGFSVPIGEWLRGPLREWAEALLDETRLRREACFDPQPVRQAWLEHQHGIRNWQHRLWAILMFQTWLDNNSS
jgi:asparagine synthase (glutamine-hydrolysing)